jgi:hypothetical protein
VSTSSRKSADANDKIALATVYRMQLCLFRHSAEHAEGAFPSSLKELSGTGCPVSDQWTSDGYEFAYVPDTSNTPVKNFRIEAKPVRKDTLATGSREFFGDQRGELSLNHTNPVSELQQTYRCAFRYRYQNDNRDYPPTLFEMNEVRDKYKNPCLNYELRQVAKDDAGLRSNDVVWSYKNYRITYAPKVTGTRVTGFTIQARPIRYDGLPGTIRSYYADESEPVLRGTPYDRAATAKDPPIPACEESYGAHCFYPYPLDTVSESKGFWVPKDPASGFSAERHPRILSVAPESFRLGSDGKLARDITVRYSLDGKLEEIREAGLELQSADRQRFDYIPVSLASAGEAIIPATTTVPLTNGKRSLNFRLLVVYTDETESRVSFRANP